MSARSEYRVFESSWLPANDPAEADGLLALVQEAYANMRSGRIEPRVPARLTADRIADIDLDSPTGTLAAAREAAELMESGDLRSAGARCFGYFNPSPAWPAVVADLIVASRNPQACVSSHAPASVAMERRVIRWMLDRIGFPADATGHFTSGGSEANATALITALTRADANHASGGVRAMAGPPMLYASADSHLAWIKLARASGIGENSVRLIRTDGRGRLLPEALRAAIEVDRANGQLPVMIAATAGTSNAGEIDPLEEILTIAGDLGVHLHVDAAWAGALVVDDAYRAILAGIEHADSVTIDAHKWLNTTMGTGMVFLRDGQAVRRAFGVTTGYMPAGDGADPYLTSLQWSRRPVGLRLWMILRASGVEAFSQAFGAQFEAAAHCRRRLTEQGWTVVNHSPLPVVLFRDDRNGIDSDGLASQVNARGTVWIGCVDYEGQRCLRACMTSFLTTHSEVDLLVSELNEARATQAASEMIA